MNNSETSTVIGGKKETQLQLRNREDNVALTNDQKKMMREMLGVPEASGAYSTKADADVIVDITAYAQTKLNALIQQRNVMNTQITNYASFVPHPPKQVITPAA
jgi:hypothetical protein